MRCTLLFVLQFIRGQSVSFFNIFKVISIFFIISFSSTTVNASPVPDSSVYVPDISSKTTYIIEIKEDGSAVWTTEEMIILTTEEDLLTWENYTNSFEYEKNRYLREYQLRINDIIVKYSNETKRDMYADDFEIDASTNETIMGTYGVTKYRFVWHGFGVVEKGRISGGDVFSDVFLSKDDVLIITLPEKYELGDVNPKPDDIRDNEVVWYGYRKFYEKKPAFEIVTKNTIYWVITFFSASIALFVFFVFRMKKGEIIEAETEVIDIKSEVGIVEKKLEINSFDTRTDEGAIIDILEKMGGEAFQSDLVGKTGFSKSKVSNLIKKMHEEGEVLKIKRGNKNLIRLNK